MSLNRVVMMGRLTKDPEIRYAQNGNAVAGFTIAVDRRFKRDGEPEADFFNCSAFGKTAEFVEKYVKKGTKVVIEGRLQNDTYNNKDGNKVTATKIMVDSMEFAESKQATAEDKPSAPTDQSGFMNVPDDVDLPFT